MLLDGFCSKNGRFHHADVRVGEFCRGCGQEQVEGRRIRETSVSASTSGSSTRIKSFPQEGDEVVNIEEEGVGKVARKGVYIPTSQTQALHNVDHLPPTSDSAARAHARSISRLARDNSISSRPPPQGRLSTSQVRATGGAIKKYFLEVRLWLVRYYIGYGCQDHERIFCFDAENRTPFRK